MRLLTLSIIWTKRNNTLANRIQWLNNRFSIIYDRLKPRQRYKQLEKVAMGTSQARLPFGHHITCDFASVKQATINKESCT